MKNLVKADQEYKDVAFYEAPVPDINTDVKKYTRLGWWVVLGGLGTFLLWASLAPLDKGVPLSGTVSVASNLKAVQHLTGGTIEEILVKEGDVVKADDVLVRMNNVQVSANAETNRVQYLISRATEARLVAERDSNGQIAFPEELIKVKDDPRIAGYLSLQEQVFASRRGAIQSEMAAINENISGIAAQNNGLEESRDNKKMQLAFVHEQLENMRELTKEGYVAHNRLLELEQTNAQINATISEDTGNIGRGQRQISELKLQKLRRMQEYQKEVRTQLSDVQKQADALGSQLTGLDYDLQKAVVKAPVAGTVVGMAVFTKGAVVAPGFKMMDIVPSDDLLVVEGQLPVHLIDKVRSGLKVELMFTAFNQNKTPHIPGEVTRISADRFTDDKTGQPYYKLVAKVAPEGVALMSDLAVKPGMSVDMFVITGERTMMNYLFKPLFDHLKLSMSEE